MKQIKSDTSVVSLVYLKDSHGSCGPRCDRDQPVAAGDIAALTKPTLK